MARITDIENPANYDETSTDDNEDSATVVTSVSTGLIKNIFIGAIGILLVIGLATLVKLKKQGNKKAKN